MSPQEPTPEELTKKMAIARLLLGNFVIEKLTLEVEAFGKQVGRTLNLYKNFGDLSFFAHSEGPTVNQAKIAYLELLSEAADDLINQFSKKEAKAVV